MLPDDTLDTLQLLLTLLAVLLPRSCRGLECFWGDAPDAKDRCEHVGRCLMYLQQ